MHSIFQVTEAAPKFPSERFAREDIMNEFVNQKTVVDLEDFEEFVDENGGFKDGNDHMVDLEGNEECKH